MGTTKPDRRRGTSFNRAKVRQTPSLLSALAVLLLARPSQAADVPRVPEAFEPCTACHSYEKDEPLQEAPPLWGVVGRKVASVEEFDYSPALQSLAGVWDRARLDQFLTNPKAMVPGTKMKLAGIRDPTKRTAVLDYLEQLAPEQPATPSGE